jgi:hypothetical protein
MIHSTREGWLKAAAESLTSTLHAAGVKMPPHWAVSVGFPKRAHKVGGAIGECWDKEVSAGNVYEMFISPTLSEPVEVLHVLLHEMIHAAVGLECKHAGLFIKTARKVGLAGKPTATYAKPGTDLHTALESLGKELGHYPHYAMTLGRKPTPKQWFLTKLVSTNEPSYKFTMAPRLIEEFGMPVDPWGDEMVAEDAER